MQKNNIAFSIDYLLWQSVFAIHIHHLRIRRAQPSREGGLSQRAAGGV